MITTCRVRRNTKAHWMQIFGHGFYVSYATVVGYEGAAGSCRLDNRWGPTTGRHINRDFGISHLEVVSDEEFERRIVKAFAMIGTDLITDRFKIAA